MTDLADTMLDYCAGCEKLLGRSRFHTYTRPSSVRWDGGRSVVAHYHCSTCGHSWTCWWSADRCPVPHDPVG